MLGEVLKATSRFAVFAATGFFISGAGLSGVSAADLGGDCCADLEERVYELESTAVRKNIRQLSMTISGRIHAAFMHWDTNGSNNNGYRSHDSVIVNDWGAGSKLQIDGRANISSDWEAGYRMSFEFDGSEPNSQFHSNVHVIGSVRSDHGLDVDGAEAYIFLRNYTIGALSIGRRSEVQSSAAKVDISGKLGVVNNVDPRAYGSNFFLVLERGDLSLVNLAMAFSASDGDGGAGDRMSLRYDSPSVGGFILSAGWANLSDQLEPQDDLDRWAVRLSYAGQFGDVRLAAAAAYWADSQASGSDSVEESGVLGSLGIMHVPSGLFVNAGIGEVDKNLESDSCQNTTIVNNDFQINPTSCGDPRFWYVTLGVSQNITPLGATTVFGTYYASSDNIAALDHTQYIANDNFDSTYWSIGIVQDIDAANMKLFATYRSLSTDAVIGSRTLADREFIELEDLDIIGVGALINF